MGLAGQAVRSGRGSEEPGRERREVKGEWWQERGDGDAVGGMDASFSGIEKTVSSRN